MPATLCDMAPPINLPFSRTKLRELRELSGLTQRELAVEMAKLGRRTPRQMISQYELGVVVPSAPVFRVLAAALGCAPADLLDEPTAGAA